MIGTLAIRGYRSIRNLVLSLDQFIITGANGSGKSSLYGAREGGLSSTLWAGLDTISRAVCQVSSVQLDTLQRAAHIVGHRLVIALEPFR